MRLEEELSARLILEQQRAPGRRRDNLNQPLDNRLEQCIEFGLFAELKRQLVEQRQCLRAIRIDRLTGLENGRRGIDHCRNIEARIMGVDQGPVVGGPARLGLRFPGRNIDL